MNRIVKIFATGFLSVWALTASAQNGEGDTKESLFNPVNYAVISQTIAPDARGGGLGDVGAATDPDVNSQYWNPAKYPFNISRAGVALNFTPWLRSLVNDMNLAYLSGYYRIGDYSAVSASLRYFNMGEVFLSNPEENDNAMTINPYEMSIDVAYSLMLSEKFPWRQPSAGSIPTCASTIRRKIRLPRLLRRISQPIIRTMSTSDRVSASWA